MKVNKVEGSLSVVKKNVPFKLTETEMELPAELVALFDLYPENTRRPVNKTIFRNEYFKLTYNMNTKDLDVFSRGDIVYSAIPYDTARNYIQHAAIQYLLHPEETREYLNMHKNNLETYIKLSIFQITHKRVNKNSIKFKQAYNAIFQNPLFEIQILGRLLQHDETGPLSANLAGKFLFSENVNTGISEYVYEYLRFVVQLTTTLPITTDGKKVEILKSNLLEKTFAYNRNEKKFLTYQSDINPELILMNQEEKISLERSVIVEKQPLDLRNKPILRSESGKEIAELKKNYIPHSVHPKYTEKYFEKVIPKENTNLLNVVSDIHSLDGKFPFVNKSFNILVGDISNSQVTNEDIKGIYVIGNHELLDILPRNRKVMKNKNFKPFLNTPWFENFLENPDESWYMLPVGDHSFYEVVKFELEKRFPQMSILNNTHVVHDGIRYIGLTIPVALVKRKKEQQQYILKYLNKLLENDYDTPTIIISHAPLFNELSMLSTKSRAYNKDYNCIEPKIEKLFKEYNIIGAIHGHHHIPASAGRSKIVKFGDRELFVVCSIYSSINTGFELMELINPQHSN
ncbi:metallophosphoesterase [Planococcus dechangensis]|uniref:Metallophosphoesterase n=1 Tax=Planococcus dechangensis TaxID=1176255 RepID=A0ABV9MEC3_9BACL